MLWLGLLAACEGTQLTAADAPEPVLVSLPVLDQRGWREYPASLDPLPSHQPAELDCEPPGWAMELERLEVNTGACNYALLEHPAQLDVPSGSEVTISLWYFDLTAAEPAQAHVGLIFGDELQWETFIDIPQPGNLLDSEFRSTRALRRDEPVRLHLHNHGRNDWLLVSVRAWVPDGQ